MGNLNNKKKVRVLEISHGLAPGGIESFLINVFENIDREKIEISFAVACKGKQFYEDRVINEGAKVYHTSDLNGIKNIITHFFKLIKLLKKEGPFDVVHSNIDFFNGINLLAAFIAGVPVRISHSHSTNSVGGKSCNASYFVKVYRKCMRILINIFSNVKLGCSLEANKYMYGNNRNTRVIRNGIDFLRFSINRNKNSDGTKFITIGRMSEAKNSLFIVKIINELLKINKNVRLDWIGDGPLKEEVISLSKKYNIYENINFLGVRRDIPELLEQADFMIFPSKWEGLPVTLVEAQVSQLPCFISDKITEEADLGLCTIISLDKNEKEWAREIDNYIKNGNYNKNIIVDRLNSFNIKNVVKEIEEIYLQT